VKKYREKGTGKRKKGKGQKSRMAHLTLFCPSVGNQESGIEERNSRYLLLAIPSLLFPFP